LKPWLPLVAMLGAALAACTHFEAPAVGRPGASTAQQILVTASQSSVMASGLAGDPATVYQRRRGYGPAPGVDRLLDRIADDYGLKRVEGWLISSLGVYCEVYELQPGQDHDEVLSKIGGDSRIESAQTMNFYRTQGVRYDDPYASMQPALVEMSIDAAQETATGRGVTIAVIDSLVDNRHPEMRGRVPIRRNLSRDHKLTGRAEVHGTAIAGVIASTANNAEGIVGIAPHSEIVSLRACWTVEESTGRALCSSFSIAQSLEVALRIGVDIAILSLSGPHDPLLERLVDAAILSGVIVVAALPERSETSDTFPASHPGVIAVGSTDIESATQHSALSAPGKEVLSTTPNSGYGFFTGNSMSAAYVAGVSALLVEQRPAINGQQVFALLAETSTAGSINACRAIAQLSDGKDCPDLDEELAAERGAAAQSSR